MGKRNNTYYSAFGAVFVSFVSRGIRSQYTFLAQNQFAVLLVIGKEYNQNDVFQ